MCRSTRRRFVSYYTSIDIVVKERLVQEDEVKFVMEKVAAGDPRVSEMRVAFCRLVSQFGGIHLVLPVVS